MAPVFVFTPLYADDAGRFLAGGNFYNVIPFEGRYDALQPTVFSFDKTKRAFGVKGNIPSVEGELRDAKWISYAGNQKVLVIARNNNELLFYKYPVLKP